MAEMNKNERQEIIKLIPSSLMKDIACFVFYDNHPKDEKTIDITVCTKSGELKEFYQRDLVSTVDLHCTSTPVDIRISRNGNCELFYIVSAEEELFIISSKKHLQIHRRLCNVDRYDISDTACSGQSCLKVTRKDDAVPLLFNINFESLEDRGILSSTQNSDDTLPIITELKRKLIEARYNTKCNEKTYSEYVKLRQKVTLKSYQNIHPNPDDSIFKDDLKNVSGALKLKTAKPWVKVCNKKIIIILDVLNDCNEPLENIHMLLNTRAQPSLVYTTKIFTKLPTSSYFEETDTYKLNPNQDYAISGVMELEEIKLNVTSRIELKGCVSYKLSGKEFLLPFEDVAISSLDSMGDEFDVLSNKKTNNNSILAVLASTVKTELHLRHIKNSDEPDGISLLDLFCTHLHMERLGDAHNVIVYRKSPYHVLNGTMIVFHGDTSGKDVSVSVYTRSPAQVLALLHYIYDGVPAKVVATAPTYKITSKTEELSHYNEEISDTPKEINFTGYATSILNRCTKILEHLDNSMIKMSESKNPEVHNKVGSHIDLFAGGVEDFKRFRQNILDETMKGIDSLFLETSDINTDSDVMIVD